MTEHVKVRRNPSAGFSNGKRVLWKCGRNRESYVVGILDLWQPGRVVPESEASSNFDRGCGARYEAQFPMGIQEIIETPSLEHLAQYFRHPPPMAVVVAKNKEPKLHDRQ